MSKINTMNNTAILYFIIGALQVFGCYLGGTEGSNETLVLVLRDALKWTLMPLLALFYYQTIVKPISAFHKKMFLAIFFSWLGDVFLIFATPQNPNFFLAGLVSFLIAHVMYVVTFLQVGEKNEEVSFTPKLLLVLPLIVYMGVLLSLLVPSFLNNEEAKPLLVPVLIYSTVIFTMVIMAINRLGRVNRESFMWTLGGALLFMVSDSFIALSTFKKDMTIPYASVWIMILYITGQFLIAKGILKQGRA